MGAPPSSRNEASRAANTVGMVRSRNAMTIRNRDHASHAQNSTVLRPSMTGPSPKSYCNHNPGSVTHGRCTRAFPSRYCLLISATARRDDRSDPGNPIATSLSWATSARILPFDCSTHSSTFGRNSSTNRGRHDRGTGTAGVPFGDHPGDGVMRTPRQVGRGTQRTGQDRTQQEFPWIPRQTSQWSLLGARRAHQHRQAEPRRDPNRGTRPGAGGCVGSVDPRSGWAVSWPPVGRNRGHQRAVSWPPTGSFSWPPTTHHKRVPSDPPGLSLERVVRQYGMCSGVLQWVRRPAGGMPSEFSSHPIWGEAPAR